MGLFYLFLHHTLAAVIINDKTSGLPCLVVTSHTHVAMVMVGVERDCVLCEVHAEAKETVFIIGTLCSLRSIS